MVKLVTKMSQDQLPNYNKPLLLKEGIVNILVTIYALFSTKFGFVAIYALFLQFFFAMYTLCSTKFIAIYMLFSAIFCCPKAYLCKLATGELITNFVR